MSTVTRPAIAFKYGEYPKRNFKCSREEFVAINGKTGTVPVGIDPINGKHYVGKRSKFDGKTGTATFSVDDDSDLLPVTLNLPDWVNEAVDEYGLALSCYFDNPRNKRLVQIDLVDKGHCPEAVIFAEGDDEAELSVGFADDEPDDHDYPQRYHEILAGLTKGRICDPAFTPQNEDQEALLAIHDEYVHDGAHCDGPHAADDDLQPAPKKGPTTMPASPITFSDEQLDEMEDQEKADLYRQLKIDRAANDRLREKVIQAEAVGFADELTRGDSPRATPAERGAIIAGYRTAARDDEKLGDAVTFSDDGKDVEGSRVDAFKALFKNRTALTLKREQVAGAVTLSAEPNEDDTKAADEARKREREATQAWAKSHS